MSEHQEGVEPGAPRGRPHPPLSQGERNYSEATSPSPDAEPLPLGEDGRGPGEGAAQPEQPAPTEPTSAAADVAYVARLLDDIRADRNWREAVASLEAGEDGAEPAEEAAPEEPEGEEEAPPRTPRVQVPSAPPADWGLPVAIEAIEAGIRAADAVVEIAPGRPVVGQPWAALRRQIHADARIYLDRQTAINLEIVAALRRVQQALDPAQLDAGLGAVWAAVGALEARLAALDDHLSARIDELGAQRAALDERLTALAAAHAKTVERLERRLAAVEGQAATLAVELEPLERLRVSLELGPEAQRSP